MWRASAHAVMTEVKAGRSVLRACIALGRIAMCFCGVQMRPAAGQHDACNAVSQMSDLLCLYFKLAKCGLMGCARL